MMYLLRWGAILLLLSNTFDMRILDLIFLLLIALLYAVVIILTSQVKELQADVYSEDTFIIECTFDDEQ